jgi:hypothetical protein
LTQGVNGILILSNDRSIKEERETSVTMLDMTEILRPFFWLMVAIAAIGPLAILFARRGDRPFFVSGSGQPLPGSAERPGRPPGTGFARWTVTPVARARVAPRT